MELGRITMKKAIVLILIYLAYVVVLNAQDWGTTGFKPSSGVGGDEITGGTCTNQAVTGIAVDTAIPTCTTLTGDYITNDSISIVSDTDFPVTDCTAQFIRDITNGGVGDCDPIVDADIPNNISVGGQKSFTILAPTSAENTGIIKIGFAVTITQVDSVCVGSSPSVTWNIKHHTDRSNAGTDTFTANQVTTSTTTGDVDNSGFNDATVAADEHIWFITSAASGTITECTFTITYTAD